MESTKRLIRKVPTAREMNSVKARQKKVGLEKDVPLLERIQRIWTNMEPIRKMRARATRFAYGDQWGDLITVNGKTMTQREYLRRQGNVVLQTNQIKNKIDTIVGVMDKERNEPVCNARDRDEQQYGEIMTNALLANCNKNKMSDLYIKWMKELCLGGLAVSYESYDDTSGPTKRLDSWTRYCNPNMVFFDSEMNDPRFWDVTLIGQFFDLSFGDLCARFARSEKDYALLKQIYPGAEDMFRVEELSFTENRNEEETLTFLAPEDRTRCRVYEVWTKESKARIRLHDTNSGEEYVVDAEDNEYRKYVKLINEQRKEQALAQGWDESEVPYIEGDGYGDTDVDRNGFFVDEYWYCRYLATDGTILWEGESPFADRSHPFTMCATPFIDGKICGYMNDAIDHNIAINRAIVLHDWLVRSQAKGVTVVPKAIVPKDVSFEEFANSWTSIDDMVFIDMKAGQEGLMPKVFYGSAQTFDVTSLISTYNQLMENSTAVSGAIQGKTPYSGTSGTLYAQMTANASTPIAALMSMFRSFIEEVATKKMKNIIANYDVARYESIAGSIDGIFDNANINLNEVADIEYDLNIKESTETPAYRAAINDDAKEFLMNGLISLEEYLMIAKVPYADKLLQQRQARQAEMEQTTQGQQMMQQGMA